MIDDPREDYVMEVYEKYETEQQSGMSECECDNPEDECECEEDEDE